MLIDIMLKFRIMNINTNALLNSLLTKLDPSVQSKMKDMSANGKLDLASVTKDKGLQTLLMDLFKDVSVGTKSKSEIVSLLETNKSTVNAKNITSELKQIINLIKSDLKHTPQLEKLTNILKSSMIDMKTLDSSVLKNSISNSGVFLESKISQQSNSPVQNLSLLSKQLKSQITLLSNIISDVKSVTPENAKVTTSQNLQTQQAPLKNVAVDIKTTIQNTQNLQSPLKNITLDNKTGSLETTKFNTTQNLQTPLNSSTTSVKSTTPVNTNLNVANMTISMNDADIEPKLKITIQAEVQKILKTIESSQTNNLSVDKSISTLKNATEQIGTLEKKLVTNNIKNEITINLKEVVSQVKNNFMFDGFVNLKKAILLVTQQMQNFTQPNTTEIKKELTNIEQKINVLQEDKPKESKLNIIKEVLSQNTKIIDKINNSNIQELIKNNLGNIKNISEDLKNNLLQLKEIVDKDLPQDSQGKELKTNLDKTLSSIDYYQLSSYASNTNHSFVSFMQDQLNDVDIKFNNSDDEFSCMINLALKEYGELKVLLVLDKQNELSINIGVEQDEFKEMVQTSLQKLRVKINSVGLALVNLNVFDLDTKKEKSDELKAYGGDSTLDFGLDIKV